MRLKRILSSALAFVLTLSLCIPGTTAYAAELSEDPSEIEEVLPTKAASCSYVSSDGQTGENVTLPEAINALNANGGGTITVTSSGLVDTESRNAYNLEVKEDIIITAQEGNPVTVYANSDTRMFWLQQGEHGKLTLGQEGMTPGLLTFDGANKATCFVSGLRANYVEYQGLRQVEINDGIIVQHFKTSVIGGCNYNLVGVMYDGYLDVTMHGGEICNNKLENLSHGESVEASVVILCAKFLMDGGSIHDNTADNSIISIPVRESAKKGDLAVITGNAKIYQNSHDTDGVVTVNSVISSGYNVILSGNAEIYECHDTADLISSSADITLQDYASIHNCTSTGSEYGYSSVRGLNVTMADHASIYDCTSESGGVISAYQKVEMSGEAAIRRCKTLHAIENYPVDGIAVDAGMSPYLKDDQDSFIMRDDAVISNCSGPGAAGGVYIKNGKATMRDRTKIEYCSTPPLADYDKIYTITTPLSAGGIYVLGGGLTMRGQSNIDHCSTYSMGGGVYMAYASGDVVLEDQASITNCTSFVDTSLDDLVNVYKAGGLYAEKSNVTMGPETQITGCQGVVGGICADAGLLDKGTINVRIDGEISGNTGTVGGGICGLKGVQLTLGDTAVIQNNTATLAGGGIALFSYCGEIAAPSTLTLHGASIVGNTAPLGGGVFLPNKADIPETPVFGSQTAAEKSSHSSATISDGTKITGNTAGNPEGGTAAEFNGGGLFLGWNTATEISGDVMISGNVDAEGLPNNMYLRKAPEFTVETPASAPAENADMEELQEYLASSLYEAIRDYVKKDFSRIDTDDMRELLKTLELVSSDEDLTDEEIQTRYADFYCNLYIVYALGGDLPGCDLSQLISLYKNESVFTPTYEEFQNIYAGLVSDGCLDAWGRYIWAICDGEQESINEYAEKFGLIKAGENYTGTMSDFISDFTSCAKENPDVFQVIGLETSLELTEESYEELWNVAPVKTVLAEPDARVSISGALTGSQIGVITEGAQYGRVVSVGIGNYALTDEDLATFTSDDPMYDVVRHPTKANQFILKPRTVEPTRYIITSEAETGGAIHPDGTVTVDAGGNQSFVITPDSGYHIADVIVDGTSVGAVSSYEFSDVQSNHNIKATFARSSNSGSSNSSGSVHFTLHYVVNGGTNYKDEDYLSGVTANLNKIPSREGYTFTGWYADKDLTEKITSVKMTQNRTVYAGWTVTGIPAMLNGDDHFAYVIGYSDGTVRPNANISRAEVAVIFFRLLRPEVRDGNLTADNSFTDVPTDMWCNKAISTMAKLGITKGRTESTFDPNANITRAEFAAICARFDTNKTDGDSNFSDISGHWAKAEIERAATLGWIQGYSDHTFRPDNYITRAEAMTMINRVLCRIPQNSDDLLSNMVVWPDNQPTDWHYLAVQEATNSHDFDRKGEVNETWSKLTSVPDWTRYQ